MNGLPRDTLDFIVIGAAKAGTTSLFEYLRRHPDLGLADDKEVPFFSNEGTMARGWDDYLQRSFFRTNAALKWGTVTPQYMLGGLLEHPNPSPSGEVYDERTVPLRIRARLPNVRLIALLRDPIERARSQHRMAVMNRLDTRPFPQAIDELLQPQALEQARRHPLEATGYVVWGEYGRLLAGYFDVFPREQILVLFTQELETDPRRLLLRIYNFIGVRSDFMPDNLGVRYRVGSTQRRVAWLGTHSVVHPWKIQQALAGKRTARRLWHLVPVSMRRQTDRVLARSVYWLDLWNRRVDAGDVEADRVTRERLRDHYTDDASRLVALLGTSPPWAT